MNRRKYLVTERQDAPGQSHRSFFFPECLYTLKRVEDGCVFRMTLTKSLRWEPGDIVQLEDLLVESISA